MYVKINGVDIDNEHSIFSQDGIKITDNRVLKDGVQTNDNNLAYTLQSCCYNSEGNVVLKFSVKNNTGYGLEYFTLSDNKAYDDLGNAYNTYVENYSYSRWNINEGGSINVTCTVENVNKNAKNITVWLYNSISNYIPTDNVVRFITIPIQK